MSYAEPVNQRSMVLDAHRNGFYQRALAGLVRPDSVVMDVGAGLGVLGLMAAKLGAAKVYLVEPTTDLSVAKEIADANGLQDKLVYVPRTAELAGELEPVDIMTSVFTGNFLLEEDLLPSLFFARQKYLKPGGALLPGKGEMFVQPVTIQDYFNQTVNAWSTAEQFVDHSVMGKYAANTVYFDRFNDVSHLALGPAVALAQMDFMRASEAACRAEVTLTVGQPGILHGVLGWFDIEFRDDVLSTSPTAPATHWSQAYLPVQEPFEVAAGDEINLIINRPERGEWSWRFTVNGRSEQHSTFLSQPFSSAALMRRSANFEPSLTEAGIAAKFVLNLFGSGETTAKIARALAQRWPEQFATDQLALAFVQQQIDRFGNA